MTMMYTCQNATINAYDTLVRELRTEFACPDVEALATALEEVLA